MAALVVLIVILAILSAADEDDDVADEDDAPAGEQESEEEPDAAAVGEPARDGQFEFTVNGFECGATTVGQDFAAEEAQGQYCLMHVRVENIGDRAQSLFADNQYLLNEDGTQYAASFEATLANDPEGQTLFAEINPGNAVEGTIVFDVPTDADISTARLHDSALSGGVEVPVQ